MVTRYTLFDPGNGDELGVLTCADDAPGEAIVELLVAAGYLDPPADCYALDDGYMLSEEGERVVVGLDNQPLITLDARAPPALEAV